MPPRHFRCRGRWPLVARGRAVRPPICARMRSSGTCGPACYCPRRLGAVGVAFFPSQRSGTLQHRCWSCRCTGNAKAAALSLNCTRSLRTHAGLQLLPQAVSRHAQREQTHVRRLSKLLVCSPLVFELGRPLSISTFWGSSLNPSLNEISL